MRASLSIPAAMLAACTGCSLPKLSAPSTDMSCKQGQVEPSDILVVTARGFSCGGGVATFGPYRASYWQAHELNYGVSSKTKTDARGLSPTRLVDADDWRAALNRRADPKHPPIVYIHGYNNSQDFAVRRARAIESLVIDSRPVVAMTWPSFANPFAVGWDEANNEWSREALGRELQLILIEHPGTTLIAHSMGNRILLDFLVNHPALMRNIGQIIAAAPDVDEDQFMQHMLADRSFGPPVTIYTSNRDQPLAASWRVHGRRRAGDLSATQEDRQIRIRYHLAPSVVEVDLTAASGDPLGHSNFIRSITGAADLCRVLNAPVSALQPRQPQERVPLVNGEPGYFELPKTPSVNDDCARRAAIAAQIDAGGR